MSARTLARTALAYLIDRPAALPLLVTAAGGERVQRVVRDAVVHHAHHEGTVLAQGSRGRRGLVAVTPADHRRARGRELARPRPRAWR